MTRPTEFELLVVPEDETTFGVEIRQAPNGTGSPKRVVVARSRQLQPVSDHFLEALRRAGLRPTALGRTRRAPVRLPEAAGVRLALVLLATRPLRKIRRIEDVSRAVRQMSDDEAYYWFAKCTDPKHGARACRAFRDLWSDR